MARFYAYMFVHCKRTPYTPGHQIRAAMRMPMHTRSAIQNAKHLTPTHTRTMARVARFSHKILCDHRSQVCKNHLWMWNAVVNIRLIWFDGVGGICLCLCVRFRKLSIDLNRVCGCESVCVVLWVVKHLGWFQ